MWPVVKDRVTVLVVAVIFVIEEAEEARLLMVVLDVARALEKKEVTPLRHF